MGHHQNRRSLLLQLIHPVIALCLEENIANRERLVHNQNLRIDGDIQSEGKADKHTAGIRLDRLVHEVSDVRKIEDIGQFLVHFLLADAHHGSVHIDVLNTGVILIEACTEFQKSANTSSGFHRTAGRGKHAGNNLQHRGLSGSVRPDDAHCLSFLHRERNIS